MRNYCNIIVIIIIVPIIVTIENRISLQNVLFSIIDLLKDYLSVNVISLKPFLKIKLACYVS